MLAGHWDRRIDLDHGQPPPGHRNRVTLPGVRLLPRQQLLAVMNSDGQRAGN